MEETFPLVPRFLLEELEKLYADRCPHLDMSDREVWYHAGEANVVRKLRYVFDHQQLEL